MILRPGTALANAQAAILRAGKPIHIAEILKTLGKEDTKKNRVGLAGSLATYARQGKIFTKPGPNIFGLVEMGGKEGVGEHNNQGLKVA